jgi:hypothetical protein
MEKRTHNLASLLHPISLDAFISTYWERNWLLVQRGDEGYYEGLLTNQNLEDIISSSDARYPAIMLAKDGVYYPPQAYCEDVKMGHVRWMPLSDLCMRLEEQLDHGIKTNVYITAGQTAGFPPH